jgi:hypothetical protein
MDRGLLSPSLPALSTSNDLFPLGLQKAGARTGCRIAI